MINGLRIMERSVLKAGMLLILAALLFQGCKKDDNSDELKADEQRLLEQYIEDNNIEVEPTESGLYYIEITEGTGRGVGNDYIVDMEYKTELIDGTVIGSSNEEVAKDNDIYNVNTLYGPIRLKVGQTFVPGLDEGLKFMKEGGVAKFIIPSSINGFGGSSTLLSPAYSTHIYTVSLIHSFNDPELFQLNQINLFLEEEGIGTDRQLITESGLYYIETSPGIGEYIKNGDIVELWYTGYFLDGRVFDSNVDETVMTVDMPAEGYIPAWDEALKLMRNGSKATIIAPYQLAYGANGAGPIPGYMTLVFEIEIEDVTSL
jgi:FKBP-type peptidyl-prolyl cis-trans isomerase